MPAVDRRLLTACAAALAAAGIAGCSGGGTTTTAGSVGERVFADSGCGSCHTFGPAGTTGKAGPNLDDAQLTPATAAAVIAKGGSGMPGYAGGLTDAELRAVARFVAGR